MMLVSQLVRDDVAHDLTMEESKHTVNTISSIELGIKKNTLNKEVMPIKQKHTSKSKEVVFYLQMWENFVLTKNYREESNWL